MIVVRIVAVIAAFGIVAGGLMQYLANHGYAVLDINNRGSSGYGSYMTLAAMAFRPEAFKVGVNIFGVSNWLRTLASIPPYWESIRKALYEEIGDPVEYLVFADEGHGFSKKKNNMEANRKIVEFLDKYLKGK